MNSNMLKLNDDKTEFIILTSPFYKGTLSVNHLSIGNVDILPVSSAKNVGVVFDHYLNMEKQVSAVCRSAFFHLRTIGAIRKFITQKACVQLVHAFVTLRLDNANALLCGMPKKSITINYKAF